MSRAIVNVATGQYVNGQDRLRLAFSDERVLPWQGIPRGCPAHQAVPYAFKAYALRDAADHLNADTLLWCDACIVPGARPLSDLWEYIEENGVWLARNGYTNYEWTADSAYTDLFPELFSGFKANGFPEGPEEGTHGRRISEAREINRIIPHVVATAFGISLKHPKGRAFLDEYYRLASETKAFCGPWINANWADPVSGIRPYTMQIGKRTENCGPSDVRGHRHDQTAASVIAWRLGIPLTECPEWFAYRSGETDKTCLIADGAY